MIHAYQYTNLTEQGRRGHDPACQYTNLSEQGRRGHDPACQYTNLDGTFMEDEESTMLTVLKIQINVSEMYLDNTNNWDAIP
jgi:hypothetical protein